MLVFALAPIAGAETAEFRLRGNGTTVIAGSTVAIDIVAGIAVAKFGVGAVTVSGGTVPAVGRLNGHLVRSPLPGLPPVSHGILRDGSVNDIVISQIYGDTGISSIPVPRGWPLYSFWVVAGCAGTTLTVDD